MKVNGYEIGEEPTREEFEVYRRVKAYNDRLDVVGLVDTRNPLTQEEFELLVYRFGKLDFGAEVWDAIMFEYERIIDERSE